MLNSLFKIIIISILISLFFSGCNSDKYGNIDEYNDKEFDNYVKEIIIHGNKTLPKITDDISMEKMSLKEKEITYKYIILYAEKDNPYKYKVNKQIKKDTVHSVCNNSNARRLLKRNYSYKYTHFTNSGYDLGTYVIFEKDCFYE